MNNFVREHAHIYVKSMFNDWNEDSGVFRGTIGPWPPFGKKKISP